MDDDCALACCGTAPRRTVSELFDRGLRRTRKSALPLAGPVVRDADNGLSTTFSLAVEGGTLAALGFSASTCVTLVAYCELVCELMRGRRIAAATDLSAADLVSELPDVPALKRDRAALAAAAFHAALAAAVPFASTGENHEGRLHLRHAAP